MVNAINLRAPCWQCGCGDGAYYPTNGQNVVRCTRCDAYQYNAPKIETGERPVSLAAVHDALGAKKRARVLCRDGRCVLCGRDASQAVLHVGHLLSVADGLAAGFDAGDINDEENLAAMCADCNAGLGSESAPLYLLTGILRRRLDAKRERVAAIKKAGNPTFRDPTPGEIAEYEAAAERED